MHTCLKCGQLTALDLDDPIAACTVCGAIHRRVARAQAERRRLDDQAAAATARRQRMARPATLMFGWLSGALCSLRRWLRPTPDAARTLKVGTVATLLACIAGGVYVATRRPKRLRVNPLYRGTPNPYNKNTGADDPRFQD